MTRFREDSMRAARQKSADRIRRADANARRKSTPMTEDALFFAERARTFADYKKDRIENGYHRFGYKQLSGHHVGPVHETGLRSETLDSAAAELWPALVPNAKRLRTSWGKSGLQKIGMKLFSLDEPYIEGNREFLGFIRIDTDRVWRSAAECRQFYESLVADGKIACAPHFLVGLTLWDGSFVRPHAIWVLPYGGAVWNAPGHSQWRSGPVDLFKAVYYGLCDALLEAGADPAAPATSQQVKNPLSPEWTTVCMQDSHFPDLTEHADYLDMGNRREKLIRRAADVQTGLDITRSNLLFNTLQRAAYDTLRKWHFGADADYRHAMQSGERGRLADNLHVVLSERVRKMDAPDLKMKDPAIELMIAKVADFAVSSWNPEKADRTASSRGAIRHVVEGMKTVKERRQASAAYSTSRKMEKSLNAMLEAVQRLKAEGKAVNKSAVARESGLVRNTVKRHWHDLESDLSASDGGWSFRCIDKKDQPNPTIPIETIEVETIDPAVSESPIMESGCANRTADRIAQTIPAVVMEAEEIVAVANAASESSVTDQGWSFRCIDKKDQPNPAVTKEEDNPTFTVTTNVPEMYQPTPCRTGYADRDDDWSEIEERESWLASLESGQAVEDSDPDDDPWCSEHGRATTGMADKLTGTTRTATIIASSIIDTANRKDVTG